MSKSEGDKPVPVAPLIVFVWAPSLVAWYVGHEFDITWMVIAGFIWFFGYFVWHWLDFIPGIREWNGGLRAGAQVARGLRRGNDARDEQQRERSERDDGITAFPLHRLLPGGAASQVS
jgi:hypothetical protein